ncbi:MAG: HDOD domain-containing protein [Syntrophobacteraceae bacterium]
MSQVAQTAALPEILAAAEKLPPFPDIIWRVTPLIRRMAPVAQIEEVIKYDQAITARILALSQSSQYSRRGGGTLREAITTLGDDQLLEVIITACASRYFTGNASGYDLREGEIWEHAVSVGLLAEIVARRLGWKNTLTAYTAGLLHDIGKTVLNYHVKTYFKDILTFVRDSQKSFLEAERAVLGIDHEQLGGIIARSWRFPNDITTAIEYHHRPNEAKEHQPIVSLIYVVNRMVSALGIGCGVDGFLQPNQDQAFLQLNITSRMVEEFLIELVEAQERTKQFLFAG